MNIWFISDTHFHHENIIKYCNRPFTNVQEMDEYMIQEWNKLVQPPDHVYHLGDVMMPKRMSSILQKLKGKLRLIIGNHDNFQSKYYGRFEKMMLWRNWKEQGFTCSHIPLPVDQLKYGICVHGHIHTNLKEGPYINLCVEQTGYKPVHMDSVIEMVKELK